MSDDDRSCAPDGPSDSDASDVLDGFHPAVARWFRGTFAAPTEPQVGAWPSIRARRHTLIAAPTGSGKTLAAFLAAIDDLVRLGLDGTLELEGTVAELPEETRVLYVSPLKALSNDIQRNLQEPLAGIRHELREMGLPDVEVRTMVRTGDTPSSARARMVKRPPHIVVTTPESLYLLLTSDGGRGMLGTVRTVIVDEIHAVADDKRGSHLALSLERLEDLVEDELVRIGLSATQKPIEEVARFLVGARPGLEAGSGHSDDERDLAGGSAGGPAEGQSQAALADPADACTIVDTGHARPLDLAIEMPPSPLEAVMSAEVWAEIYDRIAELVEQHRTTLIFVNTRRLAERVAKHLSERLAEEDVAAHHGSLSKEQRLDAEQRLKAGDLRALVATASMELGIDIGDVDLVCQLGTTWSIATLLQRVGRSGHTVGGTPKGRIFPLSRDELVEAAALLDAARRGELDRLVIPEKPLDVLAQQIVAEVSAGERGEAELYELFRRAWPYRELGRDEYDDTVRMLAEGYRTSHGRRGMFLHHDAVNGRLRARRNARLAALTSGGAIPDQADFRVVLEPGGTFVGTLDEDFAIESLPGDIFQLGNTSWRILKVEMSGKVLVEDAHGQPPTIPFWFGEAPGRTQELSQAVSSVRERVGELLREGRERYGAQVDSRDEEELGGARSSPEERESPQPQDADPSGDRADGARAALPPTLPDYTRPALDWLVDEVGLGGVAAWQLVEYLDATGEALGGMPTRERLVVERFFDEVGDQHVVIHSPYGSRLNRAWGLALRKRFCRSFNFELQAAATEDAIILSLGPTHSFPLDDVFRFLKRGSVREVLVQALLDAPMFGIRWRWNANRALAVLRWYGGSRVPPAIQRQQAEDLLATVFPDQLACLENIVGDREIPDHPLVHETIRDCLTEAMDIDELEELVASIESGDRELVARDLREPSPLAHEIINARPYAFLDEVPLEERRTRAIMTRRFTDPEEASELGRLDLAAIERVRAEAWPRVESADELHEALLMLGFLTPEEVRLGDDVHGGTEGPDSGPGWQRHLDELVAQGRATRLQVGPAHGEAGLWVAAERLGRLRRVHPAAALEPEIDVLERFAAEEMEPSEALVEVLRGRLEAAGPVTAARLAEESCVEERDAEVALAALEAEGFVFRGRFTPGARDEEWCERGLLARIHRYTISRLRNEIQPVSKQDFMRFLLTWQRLDPDERGDGPDSLGALLEQLEGFEAPAAAWEGEILPARLDEYDPAWLDALCLSGRITWGRMTAPTVSGNGGDGNGTARRPSPIRTTPVALVDRGNLELWSRDRQEGGLEALVEEANLSDPAVRVLGTLQRRGASFFAEIVSDTGLLQTQVEDALAELVFWGLVTADSFTGLRALLVPSARRPPLDGEAGRSSRRRRSTAIFGMENAGRWSLLVGAESDRARDGSPADTDEASADGSGAARDDQQRDGSAAARYRQEWRRQLADAETVAKVLLRRYGVVFRKLLERESMLPPWRDLLRVYRRLEARGDIRGGRFVAGFSGEQYALPEAVGRLRKMRRRGPDGTLVSISAADPLNLVGIVTPGDRIPALATNRVLYRDGEPVAVREAGKVRFLVEMEAREEWDAKNALVRRSVPPKLRAYLGRPA